MPLKGQAKTDYQREYMRRYRANGFGTGTDFHILERDHFRCQYCGASAKDGVRLQVDHITPRCLGGDDADDNLITACASCNGAKGGRLLTIEAENAIRPGLTVRPPGLTVRPIRRGPPKMGFEQPRAGPVDADGNILPDD